jgi:hypothetical protein
MNTSYAKVRLEFARLREIIGERDEDLRGLLRRAPVATQPIEHQVAHGLGDERRLWIEREERAQNRRGGASIADEIFPAITHRSGFCPVRRGRRLGGKFHERAHHLFCLRLFADRFEEEREERARVERHFVLLFDHRTRERGIAIPRFGEDVRNVHFQIVIGRVHHWLAQEFRRALDGVLVHLVARLLRLHQAVQNVRRLVRLRIIRFPPTPATILVLERVQTRQAIFDLLG